MLSVQACYYNENEEIINEILNAVKASGFFCFSLQLQERRKKWILLM